MLVMSLYDLRIRVMPTKVCKLLMYRASRPIELIGPIVPMNYSHWIWILFDSLFSQQN
jgi:hypothetical protein